MVQYPPIDTMTHRILLEPLEVVEGITGVAHSKQPQGDNVMSEYGSSMPKSKKVKGVANPPVMLDASYDHGK